MHPQSTGKPACEAFAWIDLIGLARWDSGGGLEAGQLRASERFLAERWNWSRSRVQRFMDKLEGRNMIVREPQAGRKPSVVTVCNYWSYQGSPITERSTSGSMDGSTSGSTNGSKVEEQEKEEVNIYKKSGRVHEGPKTPPARSKLPKTDTGRYVYPDDFDTLWNIYPPRDGGNPKGAAYEKWRARIKDGVPRADLEAAVRHYHEHMRGKGPGWQKYVVMARTFFGPAEHYVDYIDPPEREKQGGGMSKEDREKWESLMDKVDKRRDSG